MWADILTKPLQGQKQKFGDMCAFLKNKNCPRDYNDDIELKLSMRPQDDISVDPDMRRTSLCVQESPYANFLVIPARMHTRISVCVRQSRDEIFCIWGDTRLNFPYGNISHMHMSSD